MTILIKNQQRHKRLNKTKIEKVAKKILSLLERPAAELSVLFVGDKKMQQLNTVFRGIYITTDVLSFEAEIPVSKNKHHLGYESQRPVLGDIVINIPKAASQARMSGTGFYDEIYRLLTHGVLHLLGYNHEKSRYRAASMRKKEQEILNAIKKMD